MFINKHFVLKLLLKCLPINIICIYCFNLFAGKHFYALFMFVNSWAVETL